MTSILRGQVYKARFPHASGGRGKKRPVLVVQGDEYNQRLRHAVVVQFSSNLADRDDPACLFLDAASPAGVAAGLKVDSLVCCYLINVMTEDRLQEQIGELPPDMMLQVDECLKASLGLIPPAD